MKRTDLKTGETYAVLAPSQKLEDRYGFSARARKVTVLDTEPVWVDTYDGYSWRSGEPEVQAVTGPEGKPVAAKVHVRKVREDRDYKAPEAKRGVLVVEETSFRDYSAEAIHGEMTMRYDLRVVPLANVRMTYADYETKVAAVAKAKEERWAAHAKAQAEKEARGTAARIRRDRLNAVLEGTDLKAVVHGDGEVALTGPFEVLQALIETANDSAFRAVSA